MKHQWLFLNTLDSFQTVEKLVTFFVNEHNNIPHMAFQGQTPNEMYAGTGDHIPDELAAAKARAKQARLEANRAVTCLACPQARPPSEAAAA